MITKTDSERIIKNKIAELQKEPAFLYTLIDYVIGHAIVAADLEGTIVALNEGAGKIFGYGPEEIIGKKNINILSPGELGTDGKPESVIGNLLETGRLSYKEKRLRKNGERFPARILSVLTRDKAGKVDGFIEIIEDLTEHQRLENRWWDSMANFHKVVNNSADGIIILSSEGIVRFINPAAECLFARSRKDFQGKHFGFPLTSGDTTEIEIIRKTGEMVTVEMRVVETIWSDEVAYLATLRDITERKRALEAQEKLSQKLQEKVNELEVFSYAIAHDLRSPLVSIQGFVQMLRADMQSSNTKKVKEDVRIIESGVKKMGQLIKAGLEYSHAGKLVDSTVKVSFGEIVNEVVNEFGPQLRSVRATASLAKDFPEIYADRLRITQVMTNLIQNSINYRDKDRLLKIEINYQLSKDEAIFFVRDNGVGIDTSEKEKVFELFYRGTVEGEGIGAGLAITKRIIEAHGGRIWVEGRAGMGTTVYFTLPQQKVHKERDADGKDKSTSCR